MSDRQAGHWLGWDQRWYPGTPPPGWWEAPDGRWRPPEGSDVGDGAGGVPDAPYRPPARTGAPGRSFRHTAYVDVPDATTGAAAAAANAGSRSRPSLPDPRGLGSHDDEIFQVPAYVDAPNTGRPGRDVRAQAYLPEPPTTGLRGGARDGPYVPGPPAAGADLPGEAHRPNPPEAGSYPSGDLHDGDDRDGAAPGRFDSFFDPTDEGPERGRATGEGSDQDGGTRPYDGWTYGAPDAGHADRDEDGDRDGAARDPTPAADDPDATAAYDAKHFTGGPGQHPDAAAAYGAKHLFDTDGPNADADDPFAAATVGHDDADRRAAASSLDDHEWFGADAGPDDHDPFAATMVVHDDAGRGWGAGSDSPDSRPPAPWQVSVAATRRSRMAAEDDAGAGDGGDFLDGYRAWPTWARVAMPIVMVVLLLTMVVAGFLMPGGDQTATTDGTTTLPTSGGVTVTGATSTSTTTDPDAAGATDASATTESPATTAEATTTTRPRGPSTTGTTATTATSGPEGCHSSYSGCVPAEASDVDCTGRGDGPLWVDGPIEVTGPDVYDLDRNHDGTACG